jgi:hypothetical protein
MPPDGGAGMPLLGGWMTELLHPAMRSVAAHTARPVLAQRNEDLADCLQFICSCLSMASLEARPFVS